MDLRTSPPIRSTGAALAVLLTAVSFAIAAAIPYDSARLSVVQNQVAIGALSGGDEQSAKVDDVVRASNYLSTRADSRAELTFEDSSIVRVGQNAIFTFEAASRTLSLKKGAMMFFVPPGSGGGSIKTPSLTAAIAGTVGKVATDKGRELIAVLSGELKTKYGPVRAGWAIESINGRVRIFRFDPAEVATGKLYLLGGKPLPEEPEILRTQQLQQIGPPKLHHLDLQEIQLNEVVNTPVDEPPPPADKPKPKQDVPKPTPTPTDEQPAYF